MSVDHSAEIPDRLHFEQVCDQFEAAWQTSELPAISGFLEMGRESHRRQLLQELIRIDVGYRADQGNPLTSEDYELLGPEALAFAKDLIDRLEESSNPAEPEPTYVRSSPKRATNRDEVGVTEDSEQIGPYKILQEIGAGGMGQVYMAEQTKPVRRRVALKIIKSDAPSKEILARFEAERQALAMMNHQNIAKVLDAGITNDGRPYFAMELVKGVPITEYCDSNKLTPNERLDLFVQTCRAIQHAHQKGIIHRDIKPSNVLVTLYDGKPVAKVIDFGLAKALHESTQLAHRTMFTRFGQVVGTLAYMSPEQAEMNALDVDTRTDVYSLGVIFFELLTGTTPISADRIRAEAFDQILRVIREEESPRPSTRLSESGPEITGISQQRKTDPRRLSLMLKGDLDWIAIKALEKDRTRRYDGAAALADDVERYLQDEPIEARPPSLSYRLQKSFKKHRTAFFTVATVLVLLVAGLGVTATLFVRASDAEEQASAKAKEASDNLTKANASAAREQSARAELEVALARSDFQLAVSRWTEGRVAEAVQLLERIPVKHRRIEWSLARRWFDGSEKTVFFPSGGPQYLNFTPDGQKLVLYTGSDWLVWNLKTEETEITFSAAYGCLSPDGQQIVTAEDVGLQFWDRQSGTRMQLLEAGIETGLSSRAPAQLAFDPSGRWLICAQRSLSAWDMSQSRLAWELDGTGDQCHFSISPDGRHVVASNIEPSVPGRGSGEGLLLTIETGARVEAVPLGEGPHLFSPDGKFFASRGYVGLRLLKVPEWSLESDFPNVGAHEPLNQPIAFCPGGSRFAFVRQGNRVEVCSPDGTALQTLKGHTGRITSLCYSPDGSALVSGTADGVVKFWRTTTASVVATSDSSRVSGNNRTVKLPGGSTVRVGDWSVQVSKDRKTLQLEHGARGRRLTLKDEGGFRTFASDSTGTKLATTTGDLGNGLVCWDAPTGTPLWRKEIAVVDGDLVFSPNGERLAVEHFFTAGVQLRIYNAADGTSLGDVRFRDGSSLPAGDERATRLVQFHREACFAQDGERLVWLGSDSAIVCDGVDLSELLTLDASASSLLAPWLAKTSAPAAGLSRLETVVRRLDRGVVGQSRFLPTRGQVRSLTFNDDIQLVAQYESGNSDRWDLTSTSLRPQFMRSRRKEKLESADFGAARSIRSISPSGRWLAVSRDSGILLADLEMGSQSIDLWQTLAARKRLHGMRAEAALERSDSFAALFHRAWLLRLQPENPWLWDDLQATHVSFHNHYEAIRKAAGKGFPQQADSRPRNTNAPKPTLPAVVTDMLAIKRGTPEFLTESRAEDENTKAWKLVQRPTEAELQSSIRRMDDIVEKYPKGIYFNTYGVVLYRAGEYQQAIAALEKSLPLLPVEMESPAPHPYDLAFLAMSHFRLGNKAKAADYRNKFDQQLLLPRYSSDADARAFAAEVSELLAPAAP